MFTIGLVINPFAGLGGAVGLKGSDGRETRELALAKGAQPRAQERTAVALALLDTYQDKIHWVTAAGAMGEDTLLKLGLSPQVVYQPAETQTEASDTQAAVQALLESDIDLLVFAGGDGTARDVYSVVGDTQAAVQALLEAPRSSYPAQARRRQ